MQKNTYIAIGLCLALFVLIVVISEPEVNTVPDSVSESMPNASDTNLESEVDIPQEETPVTTESEPEVLEDSSVVESQSSDMDFATCIQQQAEVAEAILSSGNYKVIPIVDTEIMSMVKFCTNDDSIIHTCSAPDNKMVVTKSTNREGCEL